MEHHNDFTAQAREAEQRGELKQAAVLYEKVVAKDALNEAAVNRLLIIYRKLKEYRKEMQLLNASIKQAGIRLQQQQSTWAKKHPAAARASKSLLRTIVGHKTGTSAMPGYDGPVLTTWRKRKENLAKKLQTK